MHAIDMLLVAIQDNNVPLTEMLLASGLSIHASNALKMTPLHQAAYEGHRTMVEMLLNKGADPNVKGPFETTPLHQAAYQGHQTVVEMLLHRGADPNLQGRFGGSPLHEAASGGDQAIVELLLNNKATIDLQNSSGESPLHRAAGKGHYAVLETLLSRNSSIDLPDHERDTPLHKATHGKHYSATKVLLERGASINSINKYQETPLHLATAKGDVRTVALLLQHSPWLNIQDHNGNTPLHHAAHENYQEIVAMLLNQGAITNLQNAQRHTPLYEAAENNHTNVIKLLLDAGAGIHLESAAGNPFFHETIVPDTQITQRLISQGAYGYKHRHADQVLSGYLDSPQIHNPAHLSFYTALLVAGVRSANTEKLPEPFAKISRQIEAAIIQWLAPLKLSQDANFLKAIELAEVAYQDIVPSVLRALPRLIRWVSRINKVETDRKEAKKQGHFETWEEECLISRVADEHLTDDVRELKEATLIRLQASESDDVKPIPAELTLPFRNYFIHKTLVATLLKIYDAIPREVANYLVTEVMAAPNVCEVFYTQLFRHPWPKPFEAPMTPGMRGLTEIKLLRP